MPVHCDNIDLTITLHEDRPTAILVSDDGDRDKAVWLAKSMVDLEPTGRPNIFVITLPRWKAEAEGFI